jgi:hypothetical protein
MKLRMGLCWVYSSNTQIRHIVLYLSLLHNEYSLIRIFCLYSGAMPAAFLTHYLHRNPLLQLGCLLIVVFPC